MKFFCAAATAGGPVAIMTLAAARRWQGDGYFEVLQRESRVRLQYFTYERYCSGCLLREVDDGPFVVYHDKDAFLVLVEGYVPEDALSLKHVVPDFETAIVPKAPLELPKFGGKVAIFDFAMPGSLITLKKPGFQSLYHPGERTDDDGLPDIPGAVVLEVERGAWQVFEIYREDGSYCYWGLLFRHKSAPAKPAKLLRRRRD
jgi:hypothetical protein